MQALLEALPNSETKSVKLQNILFATDFSEASSAIMPLVAALARRYGSRIYMFHSMEPASFITSSPESRQYMERESCANVARERLRILAHGKMFSELRTIPIVRCGPPIHQLENIIEDKEIDLVVVGTHGRQGIKRLFLGSYAEEVARHLRCPVLTVGPNAFQHNLIVHGVKNILYATDMSPESWSALEHARLFASGPDAAVRFLHVLPQSTGVNPQARMLLEPLTHELHKTVRAAGFPSANCVVDFGSTAEVILRHAIEMSADLIVMGVRRTFGLERFVSENVAYGVMVGASCPVLTVREKSE
jgi:nucleotide-binding universal stress UspA family protein